MPVNTLKYLIFLFLLANNTALAVRFELSQPRQTFELGRGGSGIVKLGQYDKNSDQFLALKVLYMGLDRIASKESASGVKLVNELCANLELGKLKHVSRAIAAGLTEDNNIYFAMVPSIGGSGQDTFEYFNNNPSELNPEWIRFVVASVALSLDSVHKSGWNWRDCTVRNIVIDHETGYVKIIDFGESMRPNDLTDKNRYSGINAFSSLADWYSLGRNVLKKLLEINADKSELAADLLSLQEALMGKGEDAADNLHTLEDLKNHKTFQGFEWAKLENGIMVSPFIPKNEPKYINFLYSKNPEFEALLNSGNLQPYSMNSNQNFSVDSGLLDLLKRVHFKGVAEGLSSQISGAENIEDICRTHKEFFDSK